MVWPWAHASRQVAKSTYLKVCGSGMLLLCPVGRWFDQRMLQQVSDRISIWMFRLNSTWASHSSPMRSKQITYLPTQISC